MGRTPKPLTVLITDPDLMDHPGLVALRAQGHTVTLLESEADLVMGRKAWFADAEHLNLYLDMAIKAARAKAYPKGDDDASAKP